MTDTLTVLVDFANEDGYAEVGAAETAVEAETVALDAGYSIIEGRTRIQYPEPGQDEAYIVRAMG